VQYLATAELLGAGVGICSIRLNRRLLGLERVSQRNRLVPNQLADMAYPSKLGKVALVSKVNSCRVGEELA
jgi:hypothetical protein